MSLAGVNLPPYGTVTAQLTTDPFPPLTTGTVHMTLRLQAPGGRTEPVDRVTYTYAPWTATMCIRVKHNQMARESFRGPLRFTSMGDWWVKGRLQY